MMADTTTKLPPELLQKIHAGKCIPFIGSGVASEANVGLPSARELALKIIKESEQLDHERGTGSLERKEYRDY